MFVLIESFNDISTVEQFYSRQEERKWKKRGGGGRGDRENERSEQIWPKKFIAMIKLEWRLIYSMKIRPHSVSLKT